MFHDEFNDRVAIPGFNAVSALYALVRTPLRACLSGFVTRPTPVFVASADRMGLEDAHGAVART